MIEVVTIKGEKYSFDESTQRIFKDGVLVPGTAAEPVYSSIEHGKLPTFSGILLKTTNSILSLSGNINPITNINNI